MFSLDLMTSFLLPLIPLTPPPKRKEKKWIKKTEAQKTMKETKTKTKTETNKTNQSANCPINKGKIKII